MRGILNLLSQNASEGGLFNRLGLNRGSTNGTSVV